VSRSRTTLQIRIIAIDDNGNSESEELGAAVSANLRRVTRLRLSSLYTILTRDFPRT